MPSGLAIDDNDPLARRDQGLEFLDVTSQAHVALIDSDSKGLGRQRDEQRITNNSTAAIDTHLLVVVQGLSDKRARLLNASGSTSAGDPYIRVFLPSGTMTPGQNLVQTLIFERSPRDGQLRYSLKLLSGQGKP